MLWGWSTAEWQAIGTIVLVVVTIAYVIVTLLIARHTKRAAESAATSAASAERSLFLQIMPLVIGYKLRQQSGSTTVTVHDLGNAPAFNVMAVVRQAGREGYIGPMAVLRPRGKRVVPVATKFVPFDFPSPYEVEVTYYDALGNGYRSTRHVLLDGQSLTRVDRFDDDTKTWIQLV